MKKLLTRKRWVSFIREFFSTINCWLWISSIEIFVSHPLKSANFSSVMRNIFTEYRHVTLSELSCRCCRLWRGGSPGGGLGLWRGQEDQERQEEEAKEGKEEKEKEESREWGVWTRVQCGGRGEPEALQEREEVPGQGRDSSTSG